jgi:hypothetical protein
MFHSLALDHGALVNEVADWLQQLKMRLRSITSLNMPQLGVEAFVANIERLGVRLSATRLADGRMRLNRWRTPDAVINAQQIEDLWASQIGDSAERIDELTKYLLRRPPPHASR